jgi:hypothetical protein
VVIAVIAVGMVQAPLHEMVGVIAVRDREVSAPRAVMMLRRVTDVITRRAARGVLVALGDRVILDAPVLLMLEMAVRQIVDMALVL